MSSSQIIIARSYGQLGNRLFLYAHFIAAAHEYGVSLANPCFAEYAHLFPSTASDLWCRYPVVESDASQPSARRRRYLSQAAYLGGRLLGVTGAMKSRYEVIRLRGSEACDLEGGRFGNSLRSGRTILADGWLFRSEPLLHKHAAVVREHFQIQPAHQQNVDQVISKARQGVDIVVGVHIRHGDYATYLGGKYFYPVSQYAAAMRSIEAQFPAQRVAFLVCSNAKIHPNDFDGLNVHYGPGHIVEDMYSFAQADLLIGPPSTYTHWASFYGNVPLVFMQSADQAINVSEAMSQRSQAA
ncbi:hypothetical protein [Planctomycetes bacterium K23_9]|uniref:Glycosyl transferase family 11 n=1 Tax=Stieleria marina TaxID=1930275 RepID=A0A517P1U8_9BACT|nr:hypothetical protein K239x_53720 [Planctomycetes bacterium K23_9]